MLHGGHPSAFLIAITTTLIACLGLVHDGAHMLRTKTQTTTLAHEAARAGAQELDPDGLRAGTVALDPAAARAAAQRHARQGGARTDVDVSADAITVTATTTYRPTVLAVIGDVEIASRATVTAYTP